MRRASWLGVGMIAAFLGVGIALNRELGFSLAMLLLAGVAIAAPAGAYVLCTVVAVLTFKGLVTLGLLPEVAVFADIPLAWAALGIALLKRRRWSHQAQVMMRWLAGLTIVIFGSWAFHPTDVIRPFLYLALLGQPFALIGALLIDPPTDGVRKALSATLLGLILIQIPVAYLQAPTAPHPDFVQGTLVGAGAGAHTISAVAVIGLIWILSGGSGMGWRLPVAALLLPIPLLADAKQVVFALPAALLAGRGGQGRLGFLLRSGAVVGSVVLLIVVVPAGRVAVGYVDQTFGQGRGKVALAQVVLAEITTDPQSFLLGKGPAQTVSRSAFMTTDLLLAQGSPLRAFGLTPARLPAEIMNVGGGGSSFYSGVSSALGVLGDAGIVGMLWYLGMLAWVFMSARRRKSAEARAAAAGWAMFALLGLVFDWWEQPPFSVVLATLTGLALTQPASFGADEGEVPVSTQAGERIEA